MDRGHSRKGIYGWFGVTHPIFDHENRFVASPFLPPIVLGVIRLVFAVFMTTCIIAEPILLKNSRRTRRDAVKFPAYFTNITFISLAWFDPLSRLSSRVVISGFRVCIPSSIPSQESHLSVDILASFNFCIHYGIQQSQPSHSLSLQYSGRSYLYHPIQKPFRQQCYSGQIYPSIV
jgi:hypothetical protein